MEYVDGGNLRQHYPKGTRVPLDVVVHMTAQVASALQYAHDQNLIHRDVKPENMLWRADGVVLLSDFGLVTVAHASSSVSSFQLYGGTLPYMAPEQQKGKPQAASDQYALAVVVYEWLAGARPFQGTIPEIALQHLQVPPPSLRDQLPALPITVEQVVLKALAKEPRDRFTRVQDFANTLQEASQPTIVLPSIVNLEAPAVSSSPGVGMLSSPSPSEHQDLVTRPPRLPSRRAFLISSLVFFILVASGTGLFFFTKSNQRATDNAHAAPTATAIALQNIYNSTPTFQDSLADDTNDWGQQCATARPSFSGGVLHIADGGTGGPSLYPIGPRKPCLDFSNFVFVVEMKVLKGFGGGIIFRGSTDSCGPNDYYYFLVGADGSYSLNLWPPQDLFRLPSGSTSAIHRGLNQTNLVEVIANGSTIDLYINREKIASVSNSPWSHGTIGLFAAYDSSHSKDDTELTFSKLKIWKL